MEDIPAFFIEIGRGMQESQMVKDKKQKGIKTTSALTLLVPTSLLYSSANVVIDREVIIGAIAKFKLSSLIT
jgi:hypothetical protein